ncbi:asparagine synthase (glutamine-hydrolyzing) [Thermodesulfobacteriota bacterium]
MAAITGICRRTAEISPEMKRVEKMLSVMSHRGQFNHLINCENQYVLGLRHQYTESDSPEFFYDEGARLVIAMDGKIFVCNEENDSHDSREYGAKTVAWLYKRHGDDFSDKIDGSYSIALFDAAANKFLLLRDRLGAKPLFYSIGKDFLVFASEIKGILASALLKKSVNLHSVNNFLSCGYIPGPDTMFESIQQVKSGHMLLYRDGKMAEKPYWKFEYNEDENPVPDEDYVESFQEVFETAVSRRIKGQPDAGAFLSGGLDTSGVTAVMRNIKGQPFKVFTAGFEEEAYNEIGDAKIVADHLDLDHYTTVIRFDKKFPELLEKIIWHHDAPFADTSAIPSYHAAKLAREHVDTVLTGDFPDQLIGGSGHQVMALSRAENDPFWKAMLRNKMLNRLITRIPWRTGGTSVFDKIKRFLYRETFSLEDQRMLLNMPVPPLFKRALYSPDLLEVDLQFDPMDIARDIYREVENTDLLNKILYFDVLSYASDDLMVKVDRMTAGHGLNAFSPFHDRELVEFIAKVPSHLKIRGNERKVIMREAFGPMLPVHTLNKKKQGFAMPIGMWLVKELSAYVRQILLDGRSLERGYFNKKFMKKMVEDFLKGKTDYASGSEASIISLITLELWHRIFLDNNE